MVRFTRYLYGSVNLLNLLLLAAVVSFVMFGVVPLFHMKVKVGLPEPPHKSSAQQEAPTAQEPKPTPSLLDYAVIGENNLFHPERRIPPEKKDEKALPKPELVLYGTVISDGITVAYIEDKKAPQSTPGRGKRQTVVKLGDTLSGFIVKEIAPDRIVLSRGDEMMTVRLTEKDKQRQSDGAGGSSAPGRPAGPSATPIARSPSGNIAAGPAPVPAPVPNIPQVGRPPQPVRVVPGANPGRIP